LKVDITRDLHSTNVNTTTFSYSSSLLISRATSCTLVKRSIIPTLVFRSDVSRTVGEGVIILRAYC